MDRERLLKFLDGRKDKMIEDLIGLVKIPSVSSDINQVQKALQVKCKLVCNFPGYHQIINLTE